MRQEFPRHSFELLFASLLFLLLIPPFLGEDNQVLTKIALTLVLMSSLYLATHNKTEFCIGASVAALATVLNWSEGSFQFEGRFLLLNALFIAFMSYICLSLLRFLVRCKTANSDLIFSAMCLYIFIGNLWMFVYVSIYVIYPDSFLIPEHLAHIVESDYAQLLSVFSYYSFVTLTTLGYGDIVPIHHAARAWVAVEAVLGQFYLAIVLAKLVGLSVSSAQSKRG